MLRRAFAIVIFLCLFGLAVGASSAWAAPANDNFSSAEVISGAAGFATGTNVLATEEAGEPDHNGNSGGASVWYSWTAPASGLLVVDTFGSNFDTVLGVYTGTSVGALTVLDTNDQADGTCQSRVGVKVVAGQTYRVAVDGYADQSDADVGQVLLHWSLTVAPGNDVFSAATALATNEGTITGHNVGATKETGEPNHGWNAGGSSVWYRFTAPSNGGIAVDTFGSDFDTVLGVYTGTSVSALSAVQDGASGDYDWEAGNYQSRVAFTAVAGTTYRIAVDGKDGEMGNVALHWRFAVTPANDNFANRIALGTLDGTLTTSNLGATREAGEPVFGAWGPERSIWYSWTAPSGGALVVDTFGSNYDTLIDLCTGSTVDTLDELDANDDAEGVRQSRIVSRVTSGTTYHIGVDGGSGDAGTALLHWHFFKPDNDNLADAQMLSGNEGTVTGTTLGGTREVNEPLHGEYWGYGSASVWYYWTAPADGAVMFDTFGSDFDTLMSAYTGSAYGELSTVAENSDAFEETTACRFAFHATSGTTYRVAVDGKYGEMGNVELHWRFSSAVPSNDNFDLAEVLSGDEGTVTSNNMGATKETGEPDHGWSSGGASVWYSWTATTDTVVAFDTDGSYFDTVLGVYTGDSVDALTLIGQANDNYSYDDYERVIVHATAGTTYRIAVDGYAGDMGSLLALHYRTYPCPDNDYFADARPLVGRYGSIEGSTMGAGKEPSEPEIVAWDPGNSSVWYSWTAPDTCNVSLGTWSDEFDCLVGVFVGSDVGSLTKIAGDSISAGFDATAGVTYYVAVDGYDGGCGAFGLEWKSSPANDDMANAEALPGDSGSWTGSNEGATRENGEPYHAGYHGDTSLWFTFTSDATKVVTIDTIGSNFDTMLGVYTGTAVDSLTEVASDDEGGGDSTSLVRFRASPGVVYKVAVDGYDESVGDIFLHWNTGPAALNDDFGAAEVLGGAEGTTGASSVGATKEAGEPDHAANTGGSSLWYRFTAPSNGLLVIDTYDSDFDTLLGVYTGSTVGGLTEVGANDDFEGDQSLVAVEVTSGVTYRVAIDGRDGQAGQVGLHWSLLPRITNDNFSVATAIAGSEGTETGSNFTATKEAGEPNHAGNAGGASIWYNWTAPANGTVTFDTVGSDFDTLLGAYAGTAVNSLATLAGDDDAAGSGWSRVSFRVTSGQAYRIAVDGWNGRRGRSTLRWRLTAGGPPANDDLSARTELTGNDGTVTGSNVGGSKESGEPNHAGNTGGASIWYKWTALSSGYLVIDTFGSDFDTQIGVYTGSAVNALTQVANNQDALGTLQSRAVMQVTLGQTYQIAVDGRGGLVGNVALHWHARTPPPNDNFASAQLVSGDEGTVTGSNLGATVETSEPAHSGYGPATSSVWYSWTAPSSGVVELDTAGTDFAAALCIYKGTSLSGLTLVGRALGTGLASPARIRLPAQAGQTYMIAVDKRWGYWSAESGSVVLGWHLASPVANDMFADAEGLDGATGVSTGSNTEMTKEESEPAHAGNAGGGSMWYVWTTPADGSLLIDTLESGLDTVLGVYRGLSVEALVRVASNDDANDSGQSRVTLRTTAGSTYRIAVDGKNGARGDATIRWAFHADPGGPGNDDFANAQAMPGAAGTVTASNVGASREASEPEHAGERGRSSLWYSWTPASDCQVIIDTYGSDFDTLLGVYTGTSFGSLEYVTDDNDSGGRLQSKAVFSAQAGTAYKIAIDGNRGQTGDVALHWRVPDRPANDDFVDAQLLAEGGGTVTGSTIGATKEPLEPYHNQQDGQASVWYVWTPTTSRDVTFDTQGSDFDTVLGVYTGSSVGALAEVTSDDDSGAGVSSQVTFSATAGTTYHIAVDGYWVDDFGDVVLHWSSGGAAPPNDDFSSARVLTETAGSVSGSSVGATKEEDEPDHAEQSGGASVWYAWTAPADGTLSIDTFGSEFNTLLGVYTGTEVDDLTRRTSNDNAGTSLQSAAVCRVAAGQTYVIAVDGVGGAAGGLVLNWDWSELGADNDGFSDARSLLGAEGTVTGTNADATKEPGEPNHAGNAGGRSLWYRFTPSGDGTLTVDTMGSDFNTLLGVYTGSAVGSLSEVASNDDTQSVAQSAIEITVSPTQTYRVAVDGSDGATGTVALHWKASYVPPPPCSPVTNFRATRGNARAWLTWTNPTGDFATTRILRSMAGYATSPSDGTQVYEGVGGSLLATSLPNNVVQYFSAFARNSHGTWSTVATTAAYPRLISATVGRPSTPSIVRRNRHFTVRGSVVPAHWGASTVRVYFYRKVRRRWVRYGYRNVVLAAGVTSYKLSYRVRYAGYYYARAYHYCYDHSAKYSSIRYFRAR